MKPLLRIGFVSFLFFAFLPSAFAATVGETIKKTFDTASFSYQSEMEVGLDTGGDLDLPFTLKATISEKGGKNSGNYGDQGKAKIELKSFEDLPENFKDMTYFNAEISYRDTFLDANKVIYDEVISATVDTDDKEFKKVAGMINQFAKFLTGKSIRYSSVELGKLLDEQMPAAVSADEKELILNALQSGKTLNEMIAASTEFVDSMVSVGLLKDTVTKGTDGQEVHTVTLGDTLSKKNVELYKKALIAFLQKILPAGSEKTIKLFEQEPIRRTAKDMNNLLKSLKGAKIEIIVTTSSNGIETLNLDVDLTDALAGVPLTLTGTQIFNYTTPYDVYIPDDQNRIIDLNKIAEGIVSIANMAMGILPETDSETAQPEDDSTIYLDDAIEEQPFLLALDPMDDIKDFINDYCEADKKCIAAEVKQLQADLKNFKNMGMISNREYKAKLSALKKAFKVK